MTEDKFQSAPQNKKGGGEGGGGVNKKRDV